jgi:2-iminobutanoate/2-iminopropanoate deaminase
MGENDLSATRTRVAVPKIRKQEIKTDKAPKIHRYLPQGIRAGDLIFLSAAPIDLKGNLVKGGFEKAAKQTFENVKAVLTAAGSSMKNIVRIDVYLQNLEDFDRFNKIYAQYIPEPYPARSICQPARTPLDHPLGMVVTALA